METIPTGIDTIDAHASFNGVPLGGLPIGRITEFRTYPDAEPHRFLVRLVSRMLGDDSTREVTWLDGMYVLFQNMSLLLEEAGIKEGITVFSPPENNKEEWFLTVVSELVGLVDIIVVDGLDMLLETGQMQSVIPKLTDISNQGRICTIVRTHAWYSPRAGIDFTSAGDILQDYAALGFELFADDKLRLIYSKIGTQAN